MNIEGIIFDLDGTLADTEPYHMEAWLDVLACYGLYFDEQWFEQWIGFSDRYLAETVVRDHQLQSEPKTLLELKSTTYQRVAARSAQLYPQVEEGLKLLKQRFRMGIATNSSREDAAAVFTSTGLDAYFQAVVTASDVPMMKPAPDCYLLAAHRIGVDPAHGLAIEDSTAGVEAAKSAGFYTIAVANSHPADKLAGADRVFSNTPQAIDWILHGSFHSHS